MGEELRQHLTEISSAKLNPNNIVQAAKRDLRVLELKREGQAQPHHEYSFNMRHVRRARDIVHLVALAYFEPRRSNRPSKSLIYGNPDLLQETLIKLLKKEIA